MERKCWPVEFGRRYKGGGKSLKGAVQLPNYSHRVKLVAPKMAHLLPHRFLIDIINQVKRRYHHQNQSPLPFCSSYNCYQQYSNSISASSLRYFYYFPCLWLLIRSIHTKFKSLCVWLAIWWIILTSRLSSGLWILWD